jgi:hypothetical protein
LFLTFVAANPTYSLSAPEQVFNLENERWALVSPCEAAGLKP